LFFACAARSELRLPEPPRQHAAWRPDASIPTNILSAAETIYEQGFPDPRGCEYREIEVAVSGVWDGKVSLVKTRGWVLPKKSGTNQFCHLLERTNLSRYKSFRASRPARGNYQSIRAGHVHGDKSGERNKPNQHASFLSQLPLA
jgi:hypothetical protein